MTPIDPGELAKFQRLAEHWWEPDGPMQPLHRLNPCRLGWIRTQACRHFARDERRLQALSGLRAIDIGCGGGLLAEPLARMGATVTAIDPSDESIGTARSHARAAELTIDYRVATADDLVREGLAFDLVLASEVIEHTLDAAAFVRSLAALVSPGGMVLLTTLSRTWRSWAFGILAAEYVLGWLPAGTHEWERFVKPAELSRMMRDVGLRPVALIGMAYDPASLEFALTRDTSINYMLAAVQD